MPLSGGLRPVLKTRDRGQTVTISEETLKSIFPTIYVPSCHTLDHVLSNEFSLCLVAASEQELKTSMQQRQRELVYKREISNRTNVLTQSLPLDKIYACSQVIKEAMNRNVSAYQLEKNLNFQVKQTDKTFPEYSSLRTLQGRVKKNFEEYVKNSRNTRAKVDV